MAAVKSAAELILEAQQAQAGEDAGLEQGRQLVDSLPYCDQIDTALRSRADQLVKEEVREGFQHFGAWGGHSGTSAVWATEAGWHVMPGVRRMVNDWVV